LKRLHTIEDKILTCIVSLLLAFYVMIQYRNQITDAQEYLLAYVLTHTLAYTCMSLVSDGQTYFLC